ncbi:MAG: ATP-binding cassette domain-containing protein, partial [Candidatus Acidiferrum sp.]
MTTLLDVRGLTVELPTPTGWVRPVNEVSLRIDAGESLGLVGESGSGKTMLALALMGLLPAGARVKGEAWLSTDVNEVKEIKEVREVKEQRANGSVRSSGGTSPAPTDASSLQRSGKNLAELSAREWRTVRGREIAMVFQEPMTSL